jgi:hypothetical protein
MFSFLLGGHWKRHKPYIPLYKSCLNLLYLSSQICITSVGKSGFSAVLRITSLISAGGGGLLQDCGMATSTFTKENGRWGAMVACNESLKTSFRANLQSVARGVGKRQAWRSLMRYALSWASCIF